MSYLYQKSSVSEIGVGEKVMFLENVGDAKVGNEGEVVGVGAGTINVRLAPKTAYEQENHNLCPVIELTEGQLNLVNFQSDEVPEQAEVETEAAPTEEAPVETPADDAAPAEDTTPANEAAGDTLNNDGGEAAAPEGNANVAPEGNANVAPEGNANTAQ